VAGIALMGLPPGGAWVAKKLLLEAAASSGQWWWEVVLQAGGFLTASYVVLVLAFALRRAERPVELPKPAHRPVSRLAETAALALALVSLLLGFIATKSGMPDALSGAFSTKEIVWALIVFAGGAVLAAGLALRPLLPGGRSLAAIGRPSRQATAALGALLVRLDGALRQWAVAGIALLAVALAFGMTMLKGG
jgi:NADH:ubiquinone oxidoreductase subunit 5 (subunit L)/multisubunit Na+/H+ antiporter MnhA subunit